MEKNFVGGFQPEGSATPRRPAAPSIPPEGIAIATTRPTNDLDRIVAALRRVGPYQAPEYGDLERYAAAFDAFKREWSERFGFLATENKRDSIESIDEVARLFTDELRCKGCGSPMKYAEAGAVVTLCFDSSDPRSDPFKNNNTSGSLYECPKCGKRVVVLN